MSDKQVDLLRRDECEPYTNNQMANIKSQFHPSNTANVNIVPYHIYDADEHIVGEWRETIDGVKKSKPVYEVTKRIYNTVAWATNTELSLGISNVDNIFIVHGTFYDNNSGTSLYSPTLLYLQGASTQATLQVGLSTTNKGKLKIQASTTFGASSDRYIEVTVRYTKTSDEWQPV